MKRTPEPIRTRDLRARTGSRITGRGFRRLHRGLWVPAHAELEVADRAAALLALYPGAVVTGWMAAVLHGHAFPPRIVRDELAAPGHRIARPGIVARQHSIPSEHVVPLPPRRTGEPPIRLASPEWTLFDVARHSGRVDAICALDMSTTMRGAPYPRLRPLLQGLRRIPGKRVVLSLLDEVDLRSESPWETRLRLFLVERGLVGFTLQHWVAEYRYRLDLAWPEWRVAVEYDGEHHRTPRQQDEDERRRNRLRTAGWTIVVVTARMLQGRPDEIEYHVRTALDRARARVAAR